MNSKNWQVFLKSLPGEARVLAEDTRHYHKAIARYFHMGGIFVPGIHAVIAQDYHRNDICKVKTNRMDAVKFANTALNRLLKLQESIPEEEIRQTLKICDRQDDQSLCIAYGKTTVMKNGGFLHGCYGIVNMG